jgi:nicotinate-nucleotide adenylyltransferase
MGGTFSPIHYGHLLMCEHIWEEFQLEKIIFMPAKIPPHKAGAQVAGQQDRMEMVRLAIMDNPHFEVSDLEMQREGPSYTVDTLTTLKELYGPKQEFGLIIGADSLVQLESWREPERILALAALIVASRPDTLESSVIDASDKLREKYGARILHSKHLAMNYSSTEIRERVKKGQTIKYFVPPAVEAYIYEKGLYK